MYNITQGLKQKRDAEERYRARRNTGKFIEDVTGDVTYNDASDYTQPIVAGTGIEIIESNGVKTIKSKENALTIVSIPVIIDTLVGKDGYILAYDETLNAFVLQKAETGLEMFSFKLVDGDLILRYPEGTTPPNYTVVGEDLIVTYPDGETPPNVVINSNGDLILTMW